MIRQRLQLLLSFIDPASYRQWAILTATGLAIGLLEVAAGGVLMALLAILSNARASDIPVVGKLMPLLGGAVNPVTVLALMAVVLFVIKAIATLQQLRLQSRCVDDALLWLTRRLLSRYFDAPYEFHMRRHSGELIKNVNMAIDLIAGSMLLGIAMIVGEIFVVVGLLCLAIAASPLLTAIAVLVLGAQFAMMSLMMNGQLQQLGQRNEQLGRQSQELLQESFDIIKEISLYNLGERLTAAYVDVRGKQAAVLRTYRIVNSLPNIIVEVVIVALVALAAVAIVMADQPSNQLLPLLGLFAYLALRLKPSAMRILSGVNTIAFGLSAMELIHKDLTETPRRRREVMVGAPIIKLDREIVIEHLSYAYPDAGRQALDDVSLTIRKGDCIGVVGASGSGKTTFVDTFIGLLTTNAGRILVDGKPIDPTSEQWSRFIGYVPQSIVLLAGTLRENIALGVAPAEIDEDRLMEAVRMAQLSTLVAASPRGLDMPLGEHGSGLSGGERQRVAIARALYRRPEILVFDEATAALDLRTEAEVVRSIQQLKGQLTMLIIAHRLTAVAACNRLILFNAGKIVREGTFDEVTTDLRIEVPT